MTPEELADRVAIDDLITRFALAVDTKQYDLLDTVFTPDATIDYSRMGGMNGHFPEMKPWVTDAMAAFTVVQHLIVNRRITLDGDAAHCRSYLFNPLGVPDGQGGLRLSYVGGYYDDRCVRTPEGWRIAGRIADIAWQDGAKL